jgi:hypothetical protein
MIKDDIRPRFIVAVARKREQRSKSRQKYARDQLQAYSNKEEQARMG